MVLENKVEGQLTVKKLVHVSETIAASFTSVICNEVDVPFDQRAHVGK